MLDSSDRGTSSAYLLSTWELDGKETLCRIACGLLTKVKRDMRETELFSLQPDLTEETWLFQWTLLTYSLFEMGKPHTDLHIYIHSLVDIGLQVTSASQTAIISETCRPGLQLLVCQSAARINGFKNCDVADQVTVKKQRCRHRTFQMTLRSITIIRKFVAEVFFIDCLRRGSLRL
jgi:hypothetical protein